MPLNFLFRFLFLYRWTICVLREGDPFLGCEYMLWVWVVALIVEEVAQYSRDPENHFAHLSNKLDALLLSLHVVYMILRWISAEDHDDPSRVYSGSINTLIIACIFSWCRLLNVFAIDPSLGPLYFIIVKLFRDIFLWIFVFVIFAVSFQIGFANIVAQAGGDPTLGYPAGSFPVSFFTIIGEFDYLNSELEETPLGIGLMGIYAMIAQVMLVNLLIAMMGSTYSNVSDNSTEEWKFYRLEMVMENQTASFHPPPTNLLVYIAVPIEILISKIRSLKQSYYDPVSTSKQEEEEEELKEPFMPEITTASSDFDSAAAAAVPLSSFKATPIGSHRKSVGKSIFRVDSLPASSQARSDHQDSKLSENVDKNLKKMRLARDEVILREKLNEDTSVLGVVNRLQERLRTLTNERWNDRTFVEKKFKDLESKASASSNVPDVELRELIKQNKELITQTQQLSKENQELIIQDKQLASQNQQLIIQNQHLASQNQEILKLLLLHSHNAPQQLTK